MISTPQLTDSEKTRFSGTDPPKLAGSYIQIVFLEDDALEREFIRRCLRYPHHMYQSYREGRKVKYGRQLKPFIVSEYERHKRLTGYVHQRSQFLPAVKSKDTTGYNDKTYWVVQGYQYYTIEFIFSNGLYEQTHDVLLFTRIHEQRWSAAPDNNRIRKIYWEVFPEKTNVQIL